MRTTPAQHLTALSKSAPRSGFVAACDEHDKAIERKKCHKGKIPPPMSST